PPRIAWCGSSTPAAPRRWSPSSGTWRASRPSLPWSTAQAPKPSSFLGFLGQESALPLDTPAVTGKRAVAPHHPVAGNGERDLIAGASPGHGADGIGRTDLRGNLGVGRRRAGGNAAERVPDAMLECGPLHVER